MGLGITFLLQYLEFADGFLIVGLILDIGGAIILATPDIPIIREKLYLSDLQLTQREVEKPYDLKSGHENYEKIMQVLDEEEIGSINNNSVERKPTTVEKCSSGERILYYDDESEETLSPGGLELMIQQPTNNTEARIRRSGIATIIIGITFQLISVFNLNLLTFVPDIVSV
ncbi:hypothetical protein [Haloterrigena salina]|uniref:hypothetical protein n=1 Tax=Haloterrigena salina TaxID=504937 RepID=UPI001268D2AD|nr:hypothetical protein [Haloterrigena salina]